MKKAFTKSLAVLLALALSACSSSSAADGKSEKEQKESAVTETEEVIPEEESAEEVKFEEFTAIDNDECSVIIKELDPDNLWGYTIKVILENKSDDITYMFSVESASVNNVKTDPLFAAEVAPGKKSNEDISFTTNSLKENGITEFTDIELVFRVYDTNDWMADEAARETVHIYPYGEDAAEPFVRESSADDIVLTDNDAITAVVTGYDKDDIWGYTVNVYFLNKTENELMFAVEDASVNGFMADPFFATSLKGGKCTFTSMSWSNSSLEENGITDVEEIEFTLRVYNFDDLMADDIFNEKITLNP